MSGAARRVLEALLSSVDETRLEAALREGLGATEPVDDDTGDAAVAAAESSLHGRLVLADLLGDDIIGARPGDPSFPVRVFISKLGEHLEDDVAFTLASGLSFYFRATMDEEARVRVGLEVSRLYYSFADDVLDEAERKAVSPLLAQVMSGDLERLRFEAVDHEPVFDSSLHERGSGADPSQSSLRTPQTFMCRVAANDMVRFKAVVTT